MVTSAWIPAGIIPLQSVPLEHRQAALFAFGQRIKKPAKPRGLLEAADAEALIRALRAIAHGALPKDAFNVSPARKEHRDVFYRSLTSKQKSAAKAATHPLASRKAKERSGIRVTAPLFERLKTIWLLADEIEAALLRKRPIRLELATYLCASMTQLACGVDGDRAFGIKSRRGERRTCFADYAMQTHLNGWVASHMEYEKADGKKPKIADALDDLSKALANSKAKSLQRSTLRKNYNSATANRRSIYKLI